MSLHAVDQGFWPEDEDARHLFQTNTVATRLDATQLRHYALDLMNQRAAALAEAHRYYETLRGDVLLPPQRGSFDPTVLMRMGLASSVNIIDVSAPAIEDAWFRLQADTRFQGVSTARGFRAADFPYSVYREVVLQNLLTVRETAAVGFGRLIARLGDRLYDYWRLALPFSSKAGQVDQIMTIVVNQHPNVYRLLR